MIHLKKKKKDVIASMFLPAAVVMIFTQMTGVVANIIDGVITSRFLGSDAYSAVSLLGPMVNIVLLLASFISIGGQIVCAHKIGRGERDEANAVFSFSILFGIVIAAAFLVTAVLVPGILFRVCGVSLSKQPELYRHMLHYLHGYLIGIPAVIMVQILSPFLVMDNDKRLVTLSSAVLCISDTGGDLLNVLLFDGGISGMGVATSVSLWLQFMVLLFHFVRRSGYFGFSMKKLSVTHLKDIVGNGSLIFVKHLATILRDIATNRINLIVAVSTAAIAARGMQSDLNMLLFSISIGIGRTLISISSMYYGASDRKGLERVFGYSAWLCTVITAVVGGVLFVIAPFVSRIYTNDPEVLGLSVFSLRCMAVALPLDGLTEIFQDYLQGVQNRKMVNILCFAERFFIPIAMAYILGMTFGSKGIMASLVASKVLLIFGLFVFLCIKNRGIPGRIGDYMLLPDGFGGRSEDNLSAQIRTTDDAVRESRRTAGFCLRSDVSNM